jgi:predicted nuclease of predicted toxin-antitoxin system
VTKPLREIGLRDADDDVIIAAARRFAPIVIISKDGGLAKKVDIAGAPPQVIWLRCGNLSTLEMYAWLSTRFDAALKRVEAGEVVIEIV